MQLDQSHIGFIGPLPPPLGGIATMNRNIQRLLSSGYCIESFNTSRGNSREDMYSKKTLVDMFVQLRLIAKAIVFIVRAKSTVVNLFVTSNISFLRELLFLIAAKLMRKKVIVHLHSKTEGELFLGKRLINYYGKILNIADRVLVLSNNHSEFFSKYIRSSKLNVLENFVFVDDFVSKDSKNQLDYLYVGRMTKEKGVYDIIDAVSSIKESIPGIKIHMVGAAESEAAEQNLFEYVRKLKLEQIFKFYGTLSGKPKYKLFQQCQVFIFPSHFENSPVVLKEALAAKQIIVCSDIEANKNVLHKQNEESVIFYKAKDVMELAKKIVFSYENSNYLAKISKNIEYPNYITQDYALNTLNRLYSELEIN